MKKEQVAKKIKKVDLEQKRIDKLNAGFARLKKQREEKEKKFGKAPQSQWLKDEIATMKRDNARKLYSGMSLDEHRWKDK